MTPRVSVIVLAWNRWSLTRRCLASIARTTDPGNADVILVDNGSEDGTVEAGLEFPWLRVIRLPENLGYVRGNNAGLAHADPDSDVVLLNNDVVFEEPGWLEKLQGAAHLHPGTGIVAPRLVLPDGRLIHAGTYIVPETCRGQTIGRDESDIGQYPGSREVQGIVFAVVYIRREVVRALGPLPEQYVSFFEDTDYCLQARAAGFRVECTGDVTVRHDTGATLSDRPAEREALFEASRAVFQDRWKKRLEAAYELDLVAYTTSAQRREHGTVLVDLLLELDLMGIRVAHRDADGGDHVAASERCWGRGHFAHVFADRPIVPGSFGMVLADAAGSDVRAETAGFSRWLRRRHRDVLVAPVPIATSHYHPAALDVAPSGNQPNLLAWLRPDEVEWGRILLSAFNRACDAGGAGGLVIVTDPEMTVGDLLSLLSDAAFASGRATVLRDPFRGHENACLRRSMAGVLSWRADGPGSCDRWQTLACNRPVLFVGDRLPSDGSAPYLYAPSVATTSTPMNRVESALLWFFALPIEDRSPRDDGLRAAVAARSVRSVATSIRAAAFAHLTRRRIGIGGGGR